MSFDKYIQLCNHHQNHVHHPKIFFVPLTLSQPFPPGNHQSPFCNYVIIVFSRIWCSIQSLHLASFTQHNPVEIHPYHGSQQFVPSDCLVLMLCVAAAHIGYTFPHLLGSFHGLADMNKASPFQFHTNTCVDIGFSFPWVNIQKWDF